MHRLSSKEAHPLRLVSAKQSLKQSSSVIPYLSGFLPASSPVASTHQPVPITQLPEAVSKIRKFTESKMYVQSYYM